MMMGSLVMIAKNESYYFHHLQDYKMTDFFTSVSIKQEFSTHYRPCSTSIILLFEM